MRPFRCRTANGGNSVVSAAMLRLGAGMTVAYANSFPVLSVVSGCLAVGVTKEGN